jgi:hypothetical protein
MANDPDSANPGADPEDPRIMTGEAWDEFCQALSRSRALVLGDGVPDAPRDRAEGFRYLTRFAAAGINSCVALGDPDYPVFGRMMDHTMPWGLDAPDCIYLFASVRGDATYRITGRRGSANHMDIQVNFGHFANGDISTWGTISSISGSELDTAPDGRFELVLSPKAEGRQPGNWLALAPNAEFVLLRQYFNDWENEHPADLIIERDAAAWPPPPPRTDEIADRLAQLAMWLDRGGALWEKMSRAYLAMPPNTLVIHQPQNSDERAGMAGQAYGMGNFHCQPDEAVIVEFTPPPCRHWSFSLANYYWESIDFATRQSSLNGHQAHIDPDGVFRGVIAHSDPGVANWLDPGGHTQGSATARFLLAESGPKPAMRRVKLHALRESLPADTAFVSPQQRSESLARRRRAAWLRYRR